MNLKHFFGIMLIMTLYSSHSFAGVYKCTDNNGNTAYQSSPCADENKALEIDIKTGGSTDLSLRIKQQENNYKLEQQQKAEEKQQKELQTNRLKEAAEQSAFNQQLVKDNPVQYTAFAIPPYLTGKLPNLVKQFETRLPEIEKLRRLAAQKALATGQCKRVESDELSIRSVVDQLVFTVDCSSAKTFVYNEAELVKK